MDGRATLATRLQRVWPLLDDRTRRVTAANEAIAWGGGGISGVSRACGLSRRVIRRGIEELTERRALPAGRIRRPGGGRKAITVTDPAVVRALEAAVADETRGDPQSPLRWTCRSTRALAQALTRRHHLISHAKVGRLLRGLGCSLQSNRKTEEGRDHPDRDAQFRYINTAVKRRLTSGEPVISARRRRNSSGTT